MNQEHIEIRHTVRKQDYDDEGQFVGKEYGVVGVRIGRNIFTKRYLIPYAFHPVTEPEITLSPDDIKGHLLGEALIDIGRKMLK